MATEKDRLMGPSGHPTAPGAAPYPPMAQNWMPVPQSTIPGCPPGLEYLTQIDQILVHQQVELIELVTGWETENKYRIRNTLGQDVYFATERSNCCIRQWCGPVRPFAMTIVDYTQREVIHLDRPCRCSNPLCCFCCLQEVEVQSPPGNVIGSVKQDFSFWLPMYSILDANGDTVLKIQGPCCYSKCCEVEFEVMSADGTQPVGKITKQWSGMAKEFFTDADNFGIQFPMDLDVKMKAVMLGACFLIDFMFFERKK